MLMFRMNTVHSGGESIDNNKYKYLLDLRLSVKKDHYPESVHQSMKTQLQDVINSLNEKQRS